MLSRYFNFIKIYTYFVVSVVTDKKVEFGKPKYDMCRFKNFMEPTQKSQKMLLKVVTYGIFMCNHFFKSLRLYTYVLDKLTYSLTK